MALFRGIQEYIALDANNITLVFDSGNIVNISGNIFLYPPQCHPILYKYLHSTSIRPLLIYKEHNIGESASPCTRHCTLDSKPFTATYDPTFGYIELVTHNSLPLIPILLNLKHIFTSTDQDNRHRRKHNKFFSFSNECSI